MITTVEKVLFLKSVDLFSQIPGEDLSQIALITIEEGREAGEDVVVEGEVGDALYIVLEGKVRVHHKDKVIAQARRAGSASARWPSSTPPPARPPSPR